MQRAIKSRSGERGVTILVVVIMLIALLGMAALAVDVVTLYEAHSEAQRAADAAALSAARVFATSGYTSTPSALSWTTAPLCMTGATTLAFDANRLAHASLARNKIEGSAANIENISCNLTPNGTNGTNPQVTVTIHRTGLPSFFARIWGISAASVSASATAEAYNPSTNSAPIQVTGVKPWLIPNCVDIGCATQLITGGGLGSGGTYIGNTMTLSDNGLVSQHAGGKYFRLDMSGQLPSSCPVASAPSCSDVSGGTPYFLATACSSPIQFKCGDKIGIGDVVPIDIGAIDPDANEATDCLTHADNPGLGQNQDVFSPGTPKTITGGNNNPNPALKGVTGISRSDSVVTVPIYDDMLCPGGICPAHIPILGFAQLGILNVDVPPPAGNLDAVILNVAACAATPSGSVVSGGGVSPVPVRLIH